MMRALAAVLLCLLAVDGVRAQGVTLSDQFERGRAFERANLVEGYLAHGNRDESWDDGAAEFMEQMSAWVVGGPGRASDQYLYQRGRALVEGQGCTDPMIIALYGQVTRAAYPATSVSRKALERACPGLRESEYAPIRVALAHFELGEELREIGQDEQALEADRHAMEYLARALADVQHPLDARYVVSKVLNRVRSGLPNDTAAELIGLLEGRRIDEWSRDLLFGAFEMRLAWDARGSDFAIVDEVGFDEHLEQATRHLTRASRLHDDRPEAAALMITVSMGRGDGAGEQQWFDEAVRAQFDHPDAYDRMLFAKKPRWGGSYQAMLDFGRACAATKRYDTQVPEYLLFAIRGVCRDSGDWESIWSTPGLYDEVEAVVDGLVGDPAHQDSEHLLRSRQAVVAWKTGDLEACRELLEDLRSRFDATAMEYAQRAEKQMRQEVFPGTSSLKVLYADAAAAMEEGRFDDAVALYEQALTLPTIEIPPDIQFELLGLAQMRRAYAAGEATTFDEFVATGWNPVSGIWNGLQQSTALAGTPSTGTMIALLDIDVGRRYEASCIVDVSRSRGGATRNGGFVIGYRARQDGFKYAAATVRPEAGEVRLGGGYGAQFQAAVRTTGESARLEIAVWDDQVVLRVDGQPGLVVDLGASPFGEIDGAFGLISIRGQPSTSITTFDEFTIRRLTDMPEELR